MSVVEVVVVYDVSCPSCSEIARELPELLRVPVIVRSCRDPHLATVHPTLGARVRRCATPALGTVRGDGRIRWWPGLTGALGVLPVVRLRRLREAVALLWTALRRNRRAVRVHHLAAARYGRSSPRPSTKRRGGGRGPHRRVAPRPPGNGPG